MKRIHSRIQIGSYVQLEDFPGNWCEVLRFENDRKLLQVHERVGVFQAGHIVKYTNKIPSTEALIKTLKGEKESFES